MDSENFVGYEANDPKHFGAKNVVEEELKYICRRRDIPEDSDIKNLSGLALSGGGIRSASFSLGVMQALAHNGWLEKIDYLSTVSGGGYAGSSLSWLLSEKLNKKQTGIERFGVLNKNFPYSTYPISGADPNSHLPVQTTKDVVLSKDELKYKGKLLRHIRQQATYLTPGDGITALSLTAIILRGALMSLLVYFGLLVLAFVVIHPLLSHTLTDYGINWPLANINLTLWLTSVSSILFILLAGGYSLGTYIWSSRKRCSNDPPVDAQQGRAYHMRQFYERNAGRLVGVILALLILGVIPTVYESLQQMLTNNSSTLSDFSISGTHSGDGSMQITGTIAAPLEATDKPSKFTALIGIFSTLFGALSGVFAFLKSSSGKKGRLPMGLVVAVGTAALWFGLLLIAYFIASWMWSNQSEGALLNWWVGIAVLILFAGRFSNINYLSIHRYYRDRLMETFMPDVEKVLSNIIATRAVTRADKAPIHKLLSKKCQTGLHANPAPYHLINTNVVLESSCIPKFRGRGGDNFILSPYFCGSNATGWQHSNNLWADA